jgi:hypothetical protein
MKLWTDHANLTRQQTLDDIDVKMLRWISELISDGSEILSLSGRSAKLGDGFSRNPKGRDDLLAQRTKDLEGLIGQIRGFDLGQYSSEYPDPAPHAVPWTLGNDSLPDKVGLSGESVGSSIDRLHAVMAQVCSQPVAVFLYASGYSRPSELRTALEVLRRDLAILLPSHSIRLISIEGPFEDHEGNGAQFDAAALGRLSGLKSHKGFPS